MSKTIKIQLTEKLKLFLEFINSTQDYPEIHATKES